MHSSVALLLLLSSDQFSAVRADHQADTLLAEPFSQQQQQRAKIARKQSLSNGSLPLPESGGAMGEWALSERERNEEFWG